MVIYTFIVYGSTPSSVLIIEIKVTVSAKAEKVPRKRQGHHTKRFPHNAILPFHGDMVMDDIRTRFGMCRRLCRIFATTRSLMRTQAQRHPRKHERGQTVPGNDIAPYAISSNL